MFVVSFVHLTGSSWSASLHHHQSGWRTGGTRAIAVRHIRPFPAGRSSARHSQLAFETLVFNLNELRAIIFIYLFFIFYTHAQAMNKLFLDKQNQAHIITLAHSELHQNTSAPFFSSILASSHLQRGATLTDSARQRKRTSLCSQMGGWDFQRNLKEWFLWRSKQQRFGSRLNHFLRWRRGTLFFHHLNMPHWPPIQWQKADMSLQGNRHTDFTQCVHLFLTSWLQTCGATKWQRHV